jgi:hypothetical protein
MNLYIATKASNMGADGFQIIRMALVGFGSSARVQLRGEIDGLAFSLYPRRPFP